MAETDAELAARIAEAAGATLLALARGGLLSGARLGEVGDRQANELILAALSRLRPGDAVLSEESPDDPARLSSERVWIVDPLDGTREYSEGRGDWAVHVGLSVGGVAAAGAVALPASGRLYRSDSPPALQPPRRERPMMLVSRTRPPAEAAALAEAIGAELAQKGSAGAKAMAVVAGEADIYYHSGGQHEWDNCAPVAVALSAGLHVSRADGSPLVYNRAETLIPDLLVCRPELAPAILAFTRPGRS